MEKIALNRFTYKGYDKAKQRKCAEQNECVRLVEAYINREILKFSEGENFQLRHRTVALDCNISEREAAEVIAHTFGGSNHTFAIRHKELRPL